MPCHDPRGEHYLEHERIKKLDDLTRMLCELCFYNEANNAGFPNAQIVAWWEQHKEDDEKRLSQELKQKKHQCDQLKQRAKEFLSGLTLREERALREDGTWQQVKDFAEGQFK